jgi:5-methylcytosine-specific restriction endonuclease McrA
MLKIEEQKERNRQRALRYYYEHREDCICKRIEQRRRNLERDRQAAARSRERNRDKARERTAEWIRKNPEWHRQNARRYYYEHREECIRKKLEWKRQNRAKTREWTRAYDSSRRAERYQAPGKITGNDIRNLLQQQGEKCAICREPFPLIEVRNRYQIDHIVALSAGGSNERSNIQLLCPTCNQHKGRKTQEPDVRTQV